MGLLSDYAKNNKHPISEVEAENIKSFLMRMKHADFEFVNVSKLCCNVDSLLGVKWVSDVFEKHYFDKFNEMCSTSFLIFNEDELNVEMDVSGVIFDTNALTLIGNTVMWDFPGTAFQYKDYSLYVKYRSTNIWAFVVTGLLIVLLLIWIFKPKK